MLKQASLYNASAVAITPQIIVRGPGGVVVVPIFSEPIQPSRTGSWVGWHVLLPGHSIIVSVAAGPVHYWLSGTELEGLAD